MIWLWVIEDLLEVRGVLDHLNIRNVFDAHIVDVFADLLQPLSELKPVDGLLSEQFIHFAERFAIDDGLV